jgi:hypothetical protein
MIPDQIAMEKRGGTAEISLMPSAPEGFFVPGQLTLIQLLRVCLPEVEYRVWVLVKDI